MISAVRHDASALASERVIATIKLWQAEASNEADVRAQIDARRMLKKLAEALSRDSTFEVFNVGAATTYTPEPGDDYTVDAVELPPKPQIRRASRLSTPKRTVLPADEEEGTDSRVHRHRTHSGELADDAIVDEASSDSGRYRKAATGASMPPEGEFSEEDENPTTALPHPSSGPKRPPSVSASKPALPAPPPPPPAEEEARVPAFEEEDGGPTRHIDLPDEVLAKKADSFIRNLGLPEPTGVGEDGPERTEMAKAPRRSPPLELDDLDDEDATHAQSSGPDRPLIADLDLGFDMGEPLTPMDVPGRGHSLAPKPGVIRRRSTKSRRMNSSPRPRAAMHHVRTLYYVLMPFAGELIPLQYERRSRRFWGRWREVAGDRGVRREFIEDLLRAANDARTLVCELIAEIQSVDVRSVYALVEKMEQGGGLDSSDENGEVGTPDRQRGPLVGASVRVEGVSEDDD